MHGLLSELKCNGQEMYCKAAWLGVWPNRGKLCPMQAPLVGAVGQEYVHTVLTSMNPQNAVKEIQKHGAFRNKRCKPVLELLDQLGLKRCFSTQASFRAVNSSQYPHIWRKHPPGQYKKAGNADGAQRPRSSTVLYPGREHCWAPTEGPLMPIIGVQYRAEVYKHVLEAAKGRLLEAIPKMSPEKLTQLLELSFAYVGLPQLRDIPLAVLGQLQPVPAAFLKQLATDQELFQDLPLNVQQEVRNGCCSLSLQTFCASISPYRVPHTGVHVVLF